MAELEHFFGGDINPEAIDTTRFDIGEISTVLAAAFPATTSPAAGPGEAASASGLPGPLGELVSAVQDSSSRRELLRLLGAARLDEPVLADARIAARMVRPYSWLLDRVGAEGIKLTGAGYLPPVHVEAAAAVLDLGEEWIGKGNREVQTLPVLHLRESAAHAAWDTRTVLWRLGGFSAEHGFGPGEPTAEGTIFARAALCTWPS